MAHEHSHGEGEGTYFIDQLFTILTCGAVGLVAILMYQTNFLGRILVPMFYLPVAIGGGAIMLMAAIRAIAVWKMAGERKVALDALGEPEQNHDHGHSHSHSHAHSHGGEECAHDQLADDHGHAHAHSHGDAEVKEEVEVHDHGWAPWRYMVLVIPVFLYFLGLPRDRLEASFVSRGMSGQLEGKSTRGMLALLAGGPGYRRTDQQRIPLRFKELTEAAAIPSHQDAFEGNIGILRGQYIPSQSSDHDFTLFRVKRTCCVADEVYLETRIQAPEPISGVQTMQWVKVEGLISFEKNSRGKWIPVITLKSNKDIQTDVEAATNIDEP